MIFLTTLRYARQHRATKLRDRFINFEVRGGGVKKYVVRLRCRCARTDRNRRPVSFVEIGERKVTTGVATNPRQGKKKKTIYRQEREKIKRYP